MVKYSKGVHKKTNPYYYVIVPMLVASLMTYYFYQPLPNGNGSPIQETLVKIAGDGMSFPTNWIDLPAAWKRGNRIYVAYQGPNLDPYVTYYDLSTKQVATPVRAGDNDETNDDHGAPAICIDKNGYIHVAFGAHDDPCLYVRSTNPDDISSWSIKPNLFTGTYPHFFVDRDGRIFLLYRGVSNPLEYIKYSNSGLGDDWSNDQLIIQAPYGITYVGGIFYESAKNRLHITWVWHDPSFGTAFFHRHNIYYAYLDLDSMTMHTSLGTSLGSTVDSTEFETCKIYQSTGYTNHAPICLDSSGNPVIVFVESTSLDEYPSYNWKSAHLIGSTWQIVSLGATTDFIHDLAAVYLKGAQVYAYIVVGDYGGRSYGGDIERWIFNGQQWTRDKEILHHTQYYLNVSSVIEGYYGLLLTEVLPFGYEGGPGTGLGVYLFLSP